jgi:hypothetical protein
LTAVGHVLVSVVLGRGHFDAPVRKVFLHIMCALWLVVGMLHAAQQWVCRQQPIVGVEFAEEDIPMARSLRSSAMRVAACEVGLCVCL